MTSQALLWTAVLGVLQLFGPRIGEGRITETTASNKPPFSFSCASIGLWDSLAVCDSIPEKPFVRIEKVTVHRDTSSNIYGECLDPEKGALAGELSKWFNVECKKAVHERPEETYRVPISYLQQAIEEYCHVTPPTIRKIEVEYECARAEKTENLHVPQWNHSLWTTTPKSSYFTTTAVAGVNSGNRVPGETTTVKLSLNSKGGVIETAVFNQPPFSFACWPQLGGGTSTYCGTSGNNTYMSIDLVEIYRDSTNQVGSCLDPEKTHIKQLLDKWFNYDCKLSIEERDSEVQRMPVNMLRVAMISHCAIVFPNVFKIVAHYECVKEMQHGIVRNNGSSN